MLEAINNALEISSSPETIESHVNDYLAQKFGIAMLQAQSNEQSALLEKLYKSLGELNNLDSSFLKEMPLMIELLHSARNVLKHKEKFNQITFDLLIRNIDECLKALGK